ncbi:hypothetical protein ACH5RR_028392 [Cinchona calisaya]|uniref:ATP-dependent DNA helicase n=1 Tax=Cinchona calisaya TaxID=153742 RepID=A0ABD2YQV1_9GENT
MKQLFSSVLATVRYYSSNAGYSSGKWKQNSSYYKYKSKWNGPTTPKKFKTDEQSQVVNKNIRNGSRTPRKPRTKWTDEQSQVLSAIENGKSVFISGSAGTGKTTLVEYAVKRLKKIHGRSMVFMTASTGVAACALNGLTLHSFAGTGLGGVDRETLLSRVLSDRRACRRWNKVKTLIIDEISMIDADFFSNLEYIAREVRNQDPSFKEKVWGGIQLVVSGDFLQLPPVLKKRKKGAKEFAFEADCWNESFDFQIELTKVFRQSEADLVKLLQGMRRGESDPEDLQLLEQRCCSSEEDPSAVQLFPMIEDVNRVNKMHMMRLGKQIYAYTALDTGEESGKKQLKLGIAPDRLELCIGARVMLCKNVNAWLKLMNGSTGTIIGFDDDIKAYSDSAGDCDDRDIDSICSSDANLLPIVKFDSGQVFRIGLETWVVMEGEKVVAVRKQIPLILAWALSIHKCQGMTLDRLHTDLRRAFGCGMVYVALSRVKTLDGLHLSGFNPSKIRADPKVVQFYEKLSCQRAEQKEDVNAGRYGLTSRFGMQPPSFHFPYHLAR